MPACCGKDRQANFCPECGKPMDKRAGLRGLLRHVTAMLATAEGTAKGKAFIHETAAQRDPSSYYGHEANLKAKKEAAERARRRAEQIREWQEALIQAIDGE